MQIINRLENKKKLLFWLAFAAILLLAIVLRFYDIERRAPHHDEGVNGWFIEKIVKKGEYKYSPEHYHGPTFFYLGWFSAKIFGLSLFSLRIIPAFFGCLLCLLPLILRRQIGYSGVLTTSLLLAVMPANVFYGRYAIHEMAFVFFYTFSFVGFFLFLFFKRRSELIVSSLFLAYAAATKETIIIVGAAVFMGYLAAFFGSKGGYRYYLKNLKEQINIQNIAIFMACVVAGLFSWFGWESLQDFFKSYSFYFDLGSGQSKNSGHEKPWPYFLKLLFQYEWLILIGGLLGGVAACIRRRPYDLFIFGWCFSILLIHSVIPYKTPWVIINLTVPLCLLTGVFVSFLFSEIRKIQVRAVITLGLLILVSLNTMKTIDLSFLNFDQSQNKYTYVHTYQSVRGFRDRLSKLFDMDFRIKAGIVTNQYWPLPFVLRKYNKQVLYYGHIPKAYDHSIIISEKNQYEKIKDVVDEKYVKEVHPFRPGVDLHVYIRQKVMNKAKRRYPDEFH